MHFKVLRDLLRLPQSTLPSLPRPQSTRNFLAFLSLFQQWWWWTTVTLAKASATARTAAAATSLENAPSPQFRSSAALRRLHAQHPLVFPPFVVASLQTSRRHLRFSRSPLLSAVDVVVTVPASRSSAAGEFDMAKRARTEGGKGDAADEDKQHPSQQLHRAVGALLAIPEEAVTYVLEQTKQGATVPFLARYRQDDTGHLSEDQLRAVIATGEEVAEVQRRRQFMLSSLRERGLLTEAIKQTLMKMVHVSQLEDFWEPFKVRKTSLAGRARDAGLGPLAETLLHETQPLPPDAQHTVHAVEDGERLFIALLSEELQRCEQARQALLAELQQNGHFASNLVKSARKRSAKELTEEAFEQLKMKYRHYDARRFMVRQVNSHTMLALLRGEAKGIVRVEFGTLYESQAHAQFQAIVETNFSGVASRKQSSRAHRQGNTASRYSSFELAMLKEGLQAAFGHLMKSTANTIRRDIKKSAEREAIVVFAHNLRHMLLQRPLSHARVLAMDPGLRNGVKCVALDEAGDVIAFFKCNLMDEARMMDYIAKIVETKHLNKIVIGNGTASQQTAHIVARTIKRQQWQDVEFALVSEAGASVYSASDLAKEEFPTLDIMYRGSVSIGRRVMDPLSELVKIPVRSMGIGMYQHDVNEKELLTALSHVVESCVAAVGINSTSTNRYVMEKVPGIQKKMVDQIVLARHAKRLNSREDLRRVPGMTDAVFNQIAGFFRFPNSSEPLDNTNIHPESYGLVHRLLALFEKGELGASTLLDGHTPDKSADAAAKRRQAGLALAGLSSEHFMDLVKQLGCGVETLRMVGAELLNPALDPRASLPHAGLLRKEMKEPEDLRVGDRLDGIVQSITTFGAFVDCGFHDSVLVRTNVDELQVGTLLKGLVFQGLDHLKRVQVTYTPSTSSAEKGSGRDQRLRLEASDRVNFGDGADTSLSLHAQLSLARTAATMEKKPQQQQGPSKGKAAAVSLKRPREEKEEKVSREEMLLHRAVAGADDGERSDGSAPPAQTKARQEPSGAAADPVVLLSSASSVGSHREDGDDDDTSRTGLSSTSTLGSATAAAKSQKKMSPPPPKRASKKGKTTLARAQKGKPAGNTAEPAAAATVATIVEEIEL